MYNKHLTKKDKIALENNEFLKVRLPNHLKDQDNKGWWNLNRAYTLDAVGNCTFFCDEQKKLVLKFPVTIFHGKQDDTIPWNVAVMLEKKIKSPLKKLILIKKEDHFLGMSSTQNRIWEELSALEVFARRPSLMVLGNRENE